MFNVTFQYSVYKMLQYFRFIVSVCMGVELMHITNTIIYKDRLLIHIFVNNDKM